MFPERDDRRGRPLLIAALIFSLLVHLGGFLAWGYFGHHIAPAIAKLLPRPKPTPEIVALSDAITIEKRSVPRPVRRSRPLPKPRPRMRAAQPRPREVARMPELQRMPVPTLAPVPTTAPTAAPVYHVRQGTIHHPRAVPTPVQVAREVPRPAPPSSKSAFSPQQMAALDAQFSRTIAQAQRALTDVPPQRRPPARSPDALRYEQVMAGTPEQFLSAQGECVSIQSDRRGPFVDRYLRCVITYSDRYFEQVSFPWAFRFTRRNDPFQYDDGSYHPFPMQAPPDGFVLGHPFALSRAICSFYRAECASVIQREKANGNQPATDSP
jgi:hypothetical protein